MSNELHKHIQEGLKCFFYAFQFVCFFFPQIMMLKNSVMRNLKWSSLPKCVWRYFSHQGYSCIFIGSRSLE